MDNNKIISEISKKIEKGEEISPFLFFSSNLELLNSQVLGIAHELLERFEVPITEISILEDTGEAIKIKDIKQFLVQSELSTPYKVQIFLIENISRMTLTSYNSCLKFFEEPGVQNIVLLTNRSESGILDTILSRVQKVQGKPGSTQSVDLFYFSLLNGYINNSSPEIFFYFFRNKLEKQDYTKFLKNLILYSKNHGVFLELLEEIDEDLQAIQKNNVAAKSVVDKYLFKIKEA